MITVASPESVSFIFTTTVGLYEPGQWSVWFRAGWPGFDFWLGEFSSPTSRLDWLWGSLYNGYRVLGRAETRGWPMVSICITNGTSWRVTCDLALIVRRWELNQFRVSHALLTVLCAAPRKSTKLPFRTVDTARSTLAGINIPRNNVMTAIKMSTDN